MRIIVDPNVLFYSSEGFRPSYGGSFGSDRGGYANRGSGNGYSSRGFGSGGAGGGARPGGSFGRRPLRKLCTLFEYLSNLN